MVLRNEAGQFVMGKNMKIAGEVSVLEAEARGVYEALQWLKQLEIYNVVVESDSQVVVNAVKAREQYQFEVGHILDECSEILMNRSDLSLYYVKKQANRAAHFMARVPCMVNYFNCFTSPPDLLVEMVPSEFSS